MKKQTILITGASGFLGKRLANKLSGTNDYNLSLASSEFDLLDLKLIKERVGKIRPDVVVHLASLVDLSRDYNVAQRCIDLNVRGTLNLLESLKGIPLKKLIFTSTEEIYGANQIPFDEAQAPQPPSPYSATKIAGEYLCSQYAHMFAFPLLIFRLATFYGPGNKQERLIPQIIYRAIKSENIELNSGNKKRDYIYVDDVTDALAKGISFEPENKTDVFNIGGGQAYSLRNLVDEIVKITNSKSKIIYGAFPDRIMEADEWLMDIKKAQKTLHWFPQTSLNEGIRKTIEYYKGT